MPFAALGHNYFERLGKVHARARASARAYRIIRTRDFANFRKHSIEMEQYLFAVFVFIGIGSEPGDCRAEHLWKVCQFHLGAHIV